MRKKLTIAVLLITFAALMSGSLSCAAGVSQAEYESVQQQLAAAQAQLNEMKASAPAGTDEAVNKLEQQVKAAEEKYNALVTENGKLKNDILNLGKEGTVSGDQIADLSSQLDKLKADYAGLQTKYDALAKPFKEPLEPAVVEKAIFEAMNVERLAAGVPVFTWGFNMYPLAQANSRTMAEFNRHEWSPWGTAQYVYIGAGYSTVQSVVSGAMMTWKANTFNFEHTALSRVNTHCAIGVAKNGEVFYITNLMANYP